MKQAALKVIKELGKEIDLVEIAKSIIIENEGERSINCVACGVADRFGRAVECIAATRSGELVVVAGVYSVHR